MAQKGTLRYPELRNGTLIELESPWNNLIRALEHRDAITDAAMNNAVHEDVIVTNSFAHQGTTVGFYNVTPVTQPTALTVSDASTVDATYGVEERDVINNLRTRLDELETKLQALGLLA